MFKKNFLLIFIIIFLVGCSPSAVSYDSNVAFQNFTQSLFLSEVCSNTLNLQYTLKNPEEYQIDNPDITLGSFAHDDLASLSYLENIKSALESFSYDKLSSQNQLTYDVLSYYLNLSKEVIPFALYEEPLSPSTGIHAQLPILLAEYPFYDKEDVETYLALLDSFPSYINSLIDFEKEKANHGLFMSENAANVIIEECNSFINMGEENYLLSTFEERLNNLDDLTAGACVDFIKQNHSLVSTKIIPSYTRLVQTISQLKETSENSKGLCHLPNGQDYYTHLVRCATGSSRSVKELKKLIQKQMNADFSNLSSHSISDISSINLSPTEILDDLKTGIANTFPCPADVAVTVKEVPHALEAHLSPAFYLIPPIDHYEDNTIYINNGYLTDDISLYTTLAHEGYPGHLYQTTYFASTNPDPLRTWLNFIGYVEGWATYAEMCSYYISPLEKTTATFLQKNNSILLGIYATADIGIHYDGWSEEETFEYFQSFGLGDKETIHEIYTMILGDPANYLSYYVGYLEILELKKEFKGTQMEFHKQLLEIGPAPFEIIEAVISY